MAFVKLLKTASYFSRFQPKFRRRREGKTDYQARRCLVRQAKDKYGSTKLRLVVRKTTSKIICHIVSACIIGDKTVAYADSTELVNYGIECGLTNFAAAYATGLLVARRALTKMGLDKTFTGAETADGNEYHVEESPEGRRPLKCLLDVGITRTSTGNRVFAAMKGAVDGGLNIPHNIKRLPGYDSETKKFDPEILRSHIFGQHVAEYMAELEKADPERYHQQFSRYIKKGIKAGDIENLYMEAHKKIRCSPGKIETPKKEHTRKRVGHNIVTPKATYQRRLKLTKAEKRARVAEKLRVIAEMANNE